MDLHKKLPKHMSIKIKMNTYLIKLLSKNSNNTRILTKFYKKLSIKKSENYIIFD